MVFWFSFMIISGAISSGYHFTDDHEIIKLENQIITSGKTIFDILNKSELLEGGRFRPFYKAHRIFQVSLFGSNFFAWSVYNCLLAAFTSLVLFSYGIQTGYSKIESLLFPCLILLGSQTSIWWRLGPAEMIGTVMASCAILSICYSASSKSKRIFRDLIFIFSVILMSLSKESFILLIPGLLFWKTWPAMETGQDGSLIKSIINNLVCIIPLLLIFLAELWLTLSTIGTTAVGYAGIDRSLISFIKVCFSFFMFTSALPAVIVLFALLVLAINSYSNTSELIIFFKKSLIVLFIFIVIVFPQTLIYTKTGMFERYFLPSAFASAILCIHTCRQLRLYFPRMKNIVMSIMTLFVIVYIGYAFIAARCFAVEGIATNEFLNKIASSTTPEKPILIVADCGKQYEWTIALYTYLNYKADRKNLYLQSILNPPYSEFESNLLRSENVLKIYNNNMLGAIQNKDDINCIAIMPEIESLFLKQNSSWFNSNNFDRYVYSYPNGIVWRANEFEFVIYIQKKPIKS